MSVRQRSSPFLLSPLLLLPAACSVDATVGYNESSLAGGISCETDTVAACEESACVTSTLFDVGVYLVVIGLVLDVLRSLGAEVDRQAQEARDGLRAEAVVS